ncbi:MAG: hypothetical protein AAFY57_07975 [Cyanobacteria bacterium J06642_2]
MKRKVVAIAIVMAYLVLGCHGHHSANAQQDSVGDRVAHAHGEKAAAGAEAATNHEGMDHSEMGHGEMGHGEDHGAMKHEGMEHSGHSHGAIEVSSEMPVPEVELIVNEDAVRGWNVETKLTNFSYAPADVNETSLQNEGHAHLYVNGEKITRLYGSWYYLEELPAGSNEVKVTLNANDHKDLTLDGEIIGDAVTIEVP